VNEAEWLSCTDPQEMLEALRAAGAATDRKLRLFAVACCRRIWNVIRDKQSKAAVECSEKNADGQIGKEQLVAASKDSHEVWRRRAWRQNSRPNRPVAYAAEAATFAGNATGRPTEFFHRMRLAAKVSLTAELQTAGSVPSQPVLERCLLLREVFGNPFGAPPTIPPCVSTWNGGTVVRLADAVYEDRVLPAGTFRPDRVAVLADALEEAGVTDDAILAHLRGPAAQVRGCFVVDLLLGRS
jgi:hypothetical protein